MIKTLTGSKTQVTVSMSMLVKSRTFHIMCICNVCHKIYGVCK